MASAHSEAPSSAQVIDLMDALRASLASKGAKTAAKAAPKAAPAAEEAAVPAGALKERKGVRRAPKSEEAVVATTTTRARARK